MPLSLIRHSFRNPPPALLPGAPMPEKKYDVVIIGGGGHGLATAYNLAKYHGISRVAVLEKGWLAGGNTARNTAIIRSNYLTAEGIRFYARSMKLFGELSRELDFNVMYSERGHLTLAHTDAACRGAKWRAQMNTLLGEDARFIERREIADICPPLSLSPNARYPVLGALFHPPGAIARHDAVAWGYAIRAAKLGVHIFPHTEVVAVHQKNGRAIGVSTARDKISAGAILQATAGESSQTAKLAGLRLPITSVPLQAMVTQPLAPFLHPIVVSGSLHVYVSQTARGELVMGGAVDGRVLHSTRSTFRFKESLAAELLELFPQIGEVAVLRQWAGIADLTPDFSPLMGKTPLQNYYIDAGWGTWGFKATPVCGETIAATIAVDKTHELIEPYTLSRFADFNLVGEKGAAAVGH